MTPYELMIKTNYYLIQGGVLTDAQKDSIVEQFLASKSTAIQASRFYEGVKAPGNIDSEGRRMYPIFFIPPYNDGKKYKSILTQTPKTQIFSANTYELEILRLLYLLSPENKEVQDMVTQTLSRLKTTCFGYLDDGVGECFDASLVVLRFLAAVAPHEKEWIQSRIDNYLHHCDDRKRPWFSLWYYWLCLSELPDSIAIPELDKEKGSMLNWLQDKSCVMNSEQDKTIHPVLFCILRNALSKYSEFSYIKERQPYVKTQENGKPKEIIGRLYFDMSR